jgi:dienelactone hydrolase
MKTASVLMLVGFLAATACKKDTKDEVSSPSESAGLVERAAMSDASASRGDREDSMGQDVVGEEVNYQANGVTMKGYLAHDPAIEGKRPGVLVVHEWWGHNEYARKRADMLARLGYTALAVDMYGEGKTAEHPEDAQKFMQAIMKDFDVAKARFLAAKRVLEEHATTEAGKTAAIGYCMGGSIVLNMARAGADLDAVAAFHPGGLSPAVEADKSSFDSSVMVFLGADDPFVPKEQVEAFKKEMQGLGVSPVIESYPATVHGFTNPGASELGQKFELPLAYNESADEDSWAKLKEGLEAAFARE